MQQPTRFGEYLLLKQLGQDLFGEVYRAGKLEGTTVGDLALLRIFGTNAGPRRLIAAFESGDLTADGPGIVRAMSKGSIEGVPYLALAYASGRDLSTLARQANEGFSSLETKIAVLIAERIAKGLAVVHQSEDSKTRSYHGFLVPQLIWVTSEGETFLTGSELGPTMLEMTRTSSGFGREVLRYLSPEVRAGQTPGPSDDVYSLGALLFELLTGEKLPEDAPDRLQEVLSAACLIEDTSPLPEGLSVLLGHSLAPAASRTQRADAFHRQLSGWMAESGLRATNFDLAFFMTDLFRMELKREVEEIEAEKKIDLSQKAPAPEPTPAPAESAPAVAAPPQEYYDVDADLPSKKSPLPMIVGIAAVAALAIGGVFMMKGSGESATPAEAEAPAQAATPAPQAIDMDAIAAQMDALLAEQSSDISKEYQEQIAKLQEQLEAAQQAEIEALAAPQPAPQAPRRQAPEPVPPPRAEPEPEAEPAPPTVADESSSAPDSVEPEPVPETPTNAPTTTPAEAAPPVRPTPTPDRAAPVTPPPTPQAQVAVVPPERLNAPRPVYPDAARRAGRQATVIVKVLVSAEGKVEDAQIASNREFGFGFEDAALRAARKLKYEPAREGDQPVEMWTTVVIPFRIK